MGGTFLNALLLTLFAGLATSLGSLTIFVIKSPSPKIMAFFLGFSSGVMLLVSFMSLLSKGIEQLGVINGYLFFLSGMLFMFFIDIVVSHNYMLEQNKNIKIISANKLSFLVLIGLVIHNFPEGMATLMASLSDLRLGITLALAVALHNIPEGIAVALPIYLQSKNKFKAFFLSSLSGVSEVLGALIAYLFLKPFLNESTLAAILAMVGGLMVFISLDELLPASKSYNMEHVSIIGVIAGMMLMAISLSCIKL